MTYRLTVIDCTMIYTKTVATLKREAWQRAQAAYEARHLYDAVRLVSIVLAVITIVPVAFAAIA